VREQGLPNLTSWLFPRPMWAARPDSMDALRRFARGKSFATGLSGAWSDFKSSLRGGRAVLDGAYNKLTRVPQPMWPNLADGGWAEKQSRMHRAFGVFEVLHLLEQAPDPENRVMLGEGLDVLGRRKAYLKSHWREIDQRGVDHGQQLLDQGLRAAGIGYFDADRRDGEMIWSSHGASHHIGTTRMSQSPRNGVVDDQCKVHGVKNLFVAGSATFPTGSSLNPTLTIVALAARLADRVRVLLDGELAVSSPAVGSTIAAAAGEGVSN
jgi:choline dehydrogenase-like flavoprotein